jgi:hypothetical protein
MKKFEFEKQGIKFYFKNPKLNQYGKLIMAYKIESIHENKHDPEGYYFNSEFMPDKNAMSFYDVKIKGKKVDGVGLPENILTEVKTIFQQFKTEREQNINQVVTELVTGQRNIHFGIVGCDYPHYQPWIRDISKDLDGLEQDIMTKAIKEMIGKDEWVSNSCDYIEKKVKKHIGLIEDLGDVLNPEYDEESHKYHGYKNTVVTGFEMKLEDILQGRIEKKKEKDVTKQILEEEKKTMIIEILKQGYNQEEEKDPYAKIKITNPITNESALFNCRNIFDFGYVVNPDFAIVKGIEPGGMLNKENYWETFEHNKGWYPVRKATEFEIKAVKYLYKFPPIYSGIRM